jgi:hypothetical protein
MAITFIKNPEDPGAYYQAVLGLVFTLLCWPVMLLRFYVRRCLVDCLGKDDIIAMLGLVSFLSSTSSSYSRTLRILTAPTIIDHIHSILRDSYRA